jgi:hypothetical protein
MKALTEKSRVSSSSAAPDSLCFSDGRVAHLPVRVEGFCPISLEIRPSLKQSEFGVPPA